MKAVEIRLLKEQDQSFLFYHETNPFSRWHYHPDIELVLIIKGEGKEWWAITSIVLKRVTLYFWQQPSARMALRRKLL